jgi:hypothetical protein
MERLLTGELPEPEGEDWGEFIAWKYFDEPTQGLPPAPSAEGRRLLAGRAPECPERFGSNSRAPASFERLQSSLAIRAVYTSTSPQHFSARFTLSSRRTCLSARRAAVDPTRKSETVALSLRH